MNARSRSNRRPAGDRSPSARPAFGAASRSREPDDGTAAAWLLRLVDFGLAAILFIAPLFMGGRHEIGRLVYVSVIGFTATAWSIRQWFLASPRYRWSGAEPILLAAVMLVILQLVPLPQSVLLWISPEIGELLPMWTGQASAGGSLGTWNQLSLAPMATQAGLVTLLAHVLLFLVVVQRLQDTRDIERMLKWVASASILMASVGLAQFLFGNGKFLWIYEHPSRDTFYAVKGAFQNQNHFAGFLAAGVGPLLWWMRVHVLRHTDSSRVDRRSRGGRIWLPTATVLWVGLATVALAALLTFSRGGVLALSCAIVVSSVALARCRLVDLRTLLALTGIGALLAISLTIHGYEPLARKMSLLKNSESFEELLNGRAALWSAHMEIIPRFPWVGTGAGSHAHVYRTYYTEHSDREFTHGENGYLHVLVENGWLGLGLTLAAITLAAYWSASTIFSGSDPGFAGASGAVLATMIASLVQSVGDFVWYIPACLSLTVVAAAIACRLYQIRIQAEGSLALSGRLSSYLAERTLRLPILARATATALTIGIATAMVLEGLPPARAALHWDAYFKVSRATREAGEISPEQTREMVVHLRQTLHRNPYHARANLRLASQYLRLFDMAQQQSENPMALAQIREAALASEFPSRAALDDWLHAVMGPRRELLDAALAHVKHSTSLSPLQGDAYIYLSELSFLESTDIQFERACTNQALLASPNNGLVLLAAGSEAALRGDVATTLRLWKRGFAIDPEQRTRLIEMLAGTIPAQEFITEFQPERDGLQKLFDFYENQGDLQQAKLVAPSLLAAIEVDVADRAPNEKASMWDRARQVNETIGDTAIAVECARRASSLTPDHFGRRFRLALAYRQNQQFQEAFDAFRWCLRRKPDDENLQKVLAEVAKQRITERSASHIR